MHHPLALRAYTELYGKEPSKTLEVKYHGRFTGYNGRVTSFPARIVFSLSRTFEEASDEIQIGVMQQLLNRLHKTKQDTMEIQLYTSFIKKMTDYAATTNIDPLLKTRFDEINTAYFDNFMMTPNLTWGTHSLTKLGHYTFATDTISLSTALKDDVAMLDYVLYHEMLHKKHKFDERAGGFTRSHTKAFRTDERKFRLPDGADPEKRLEAFVRRKRREARFGGGDAHDSRAARAPRTRRPRKGFLESLFDYF